MSTDSPDAPRSLPARPHLGHLKDQAKDLVKSGVAASIAAAQFQIARRYGFASWPKLKAHVESLAAMRTREQASDAQDVDRRDAWQLQRAIDVEDFARVKSLMTANPDLHRAQIGYGGNGPLTWVAECRVPWRPPSAARLAIAEWMIDNGSDVHQGGDGPLMRAALNGDRVPMMALLVAKGADVNALWSGTFPIVFAPCETVDPVALKWLLDHDANPDGPPDGRDSRGTALDYVIGSYARSPQLGNCIELLLAAGGTTRYDVPVVLDLLRGRLDRVREHLDADPALLTRRFPGLDFGASGGRRLTLVGATLLHIAAEYQNVDAVRLLLDLGADVNGRALIDDAGVGGQTAIFHAVTQSDDGGVPVARLLIDRGADLSLRATIPGHYERPDEVIEGTPLGYVLRVRDDPRGSEIVALLRASGAPV
jgi:ankyrin repeat protein